MEDERPAFKLEGGVARIEVRARWEPTSPASERLAVALWWRTSECCATGEVEEGARSVTLRMDAPDAGNYELDAWPAMPAGAAVEQTVNYELVVTYRG